MEIKKYKDIYYIGHKAHLRKVQAVLCSIRTALETKRKTTRHSLETILLIDFKL